MSNLSQIDGATHMDLYAGEHAGLAVEKLVPFFCATSDLVRPTRFA